MKNNTIPHEEWKPVPVDEFKNYYEVSSFGRVRSKTYVQYRNVGGKNRPYTVRGKVLSQTTNFGYKLVHLSVNGHSKYFRVHRLVAAAFIPNPDNLPQINHRDEDKQNNNVNNLEWCSSKYNVNYGTRGIRAGIKRGNPVIQKSIDGTMVRKFHSIQNASKVTGISAGNIWSMLNGKRNNAGGYLWEYA